MRTWTLEQLLLLRADPQHQLVFHREQQRRVGDLVLVALIAGDALVEVLDAPSDARCGELLQEGTL